VTRLADVANVTVLTAGLESYAWGDVFLAAKLRGEWDELDAGLRKGIAAVAAAPPSDAPVTRAGNAWRRTRRLLAADELREWLSAHRLKLADWRAYFERAVARDGARVDPGAACAEQVADAIWAEGTCSGAFERYAAALAERAAALGTAPSVQGIPPPAWFERTPSHDEARALGLDPGDVAHRVERLWRGERAHRRLSDSVRASDDVRKTVIAKTVDWLRVDCDLLQTGAEDTAREAVLLVREDGMDLSDVARQAGLPLAAERLFVGELPAELRAPLVSAAPGELVGPVALDVDGPYLVVSVKDKVVPSIDDAEIRARAQHAAVSAALAREVRDRVRWHEHGR
jgi:hypothetical protein